LADQIQKELASLLHLEVKDPRINFITITDVELSVDYSVAKIFYSTFPSDSDRLLTTQAGLEAVVGFLRSKISSRIRLHHAPELKFIYDDSLERGRFLSNLIEEACDKPSK
jgi:ribosome-binding factor A